MSETFNGTYMPVPEALSAVCVIYFDRADATPKLRTSADAFAWLVRDLAQWGRVDFKRVDGKLFIEYPTAMGMVLAHADRECPSGRGFLRCSPTLTVEIELCA